MDFNQLERALVVHYKQQNRLLFIVLSLFTIVFFPVLLLYLPLIGFWLLCAPIFSLQLSCALFSLGLLNFLIVHAYSQIFPKRLHLWARTLFTHVKFNQLIKRRLQGYCSLSYVAIFLGLIQTDVTLFVLLRLTMACAINYFIIRLMSVRYLANSQKKESDTRLSSLTFLFSALSDSALLGICLMISASISFAMIWSAQQSYISIWVFIIFCVLNLPIWLKWRKILLKNLNIHTLFFKSLSEQYYKTQKCLFQAIIGCTLFLIIAVPLALLVIQRVFLS